MSPKLGSKQETLSRLAVDEHPAGCHVLPYRNLRVQMLLGTSPGGHD